MTSRDIFQALDTQESATLEMVIARMEARAQEPRYAEMRRAYLDRLDLANQVLRHTRRQRAAAHDQVHLARLLSEVHGGLTRRVNIPASMSIPSIDGSGTITRSIDIPLTSSSPA